MSYGNGLRLSEQRDAGSTNVGYNNMELQRKLTTFEGVMATITESCEPGTRNLI
jgi:hypothetical protein